MISPLPAPKPNDSRPIWELVIEDMKGRDALGRETYGTPLQAGNGRDSLQDAYDEALDLSAYLKKEIEERKAQQIRIDDLELALKACLPQIHQCGSSNCAADGHRECPYGLALAAVEHVPAAVKDSWTAHAGDSRV